MKLATEDLSADQLRLVKALKSIRVGKGSSLTDDDIVKICEKVTSAFRLEHPMPKGTTRQTEQWLLRRAATVAITETGRATGS